MKQCNCVLYQYIATNLVSLLVNFSKFQKISVAVAGLVKTKVNKTLYTGCQKVDLSMVLETKNNNVGFQS